MRNCHVFHLEKARAEEQGPDWELYGNKPAVPPLMTEAVPSVVYLVDYLEQKR